MAKLTTIDRATWERAELFEHYLTRRRTYYAITVQLDVTATVDRLRRTGHKTYPVQIWALATVVNRRREFRMALDPAGRPAVWDRVDPSFTVFNPERETFSNVWATYDPDFPAFHDVASELLVAHREATSPFPQGFPPPSNLFDISSIPWTPFTSFTLHVESGWDHLAPAFTIGQHTTGDGRTHMPLALQIHHSAADGFHAAMFLRELQDLLLEPDWLG